jgi:hypothetical protein
VTPEELSAFAAEVTAAHAAMDGKGPGTAEWDAWFAIKDRWARRPHGRAAAPGDLDGWQLPGEWPFGGNVRCRRCGAVSSLEGHPHGCPRTPGDIGEQGLLHALRSCYCGQALVITPGTSGPCCTGTPPVAVPGGCRWCGSSLCRVNEPDDEPEKDYYVESRYPDMGDAWVHARCVDDRLRARGSHDDAERRRARRQVPLGVINP